jgi:hypothetical protein
MTSLQSLGSSFNKEFEPSLWTVVMHELPWVPVNHLLQPQWFWISPRVSGREWIKQLHEAVAIALPTASGFYDLSIAQFETCYGPHCFLSYPAPTKITYSPGPWYCPRQDSSRQGSKPTGLYATEKTLMSYLSPLERGPGPFDDTEIRYWSDSTFEEPSS